jgi:hypothetical protein
VVLYRMSLFSISFSWGDHNLSFGWMFDFQRDGNFFEQGEESRILKAVGLSWHASKGAKVAVMIR